jgi:hypothetical protein
MSRIRNWQRCFSSSLSDHQAKIKRCGQLAACRANVEEAVAQNGWDSIVDLSFYGWPGASVVNGGRSIRSRRVGTDVKVPPAVALNLGVQGQSKSLAPARLRNKAFAIERGLASAEPAR